MWSVDMLNPRNGRGVREARLIQVVQALEGALVVEDERRHIVLANQAFCELFGLQVAPSDLEGVSCVESAEASKHLFADPDVFVAGVDALLRGGSARLAEQLEMADGRVLSRDYLPVHVEGFHRGHVWHYRNVTAAVRHAQGLQTQRAVSAALARADQSIADRLRAALEAITRGFGWDLVLLLRDDERPAAPGEPSSGRLCEAAFSALSELTPDELCDAVAEGCGSDGTGDSGTDQPRWIDCVQPPPGVDVSALTRLRLATAIVAPARCDATGRCSLLLGSRRRLAVDPEVMAALGYVAAQLVQWLDRRRSEVARAIAENRLSAIVGHMLEGLLVLAMPDGRVLQANAAARRLFGGTLDPLEGLRIQDLFVEDAARPLLERALVDGFGKRAECAARLGNGSLAPVETALFDIGGGLAGLTIRDLRDQRRDERLRRRFASIVGHELRTPIASIRSALSLLEDGIGGALSDKGHELVAIASRSSERLLRLIGDLLTLDRLDSGSVSLDVTAMPVSVILAHARDAIWSQLDGAGIALDVEAGDAAEAVVLADEMRAVQVLTNLLSNALKFSPPGGMVRVRVSRVDRAVRIAVIDEGPGIPEDEQDGIFEPFHQVDTGRPREGSGLGLTICRAIVRQLGGDIGVRSSPGAGATFWFTLPCAPTA